MKKIYLSFFLLLFFVLAAGAQKHYFSDSTKVSLITCSPGKEIYAVFGHSAIRVNDPLTEQDIVFNFGIFDFNTDNFYLKFIQGETDYQVVYYDFVYFLPEYIRRNATVWQQELNLNPEEKQNLIAALFKNCELENKIYRYNFIFDNCATRPRDKIYESIRGDVLGEPANEAKSFREWVAMCTDKDSWLMFGIDMLFGAESDKLATTEEAMFLPEILMQEYANKEIVDLRDATVRPLVKKTTVLVQAQPEEPKTSFLLFQPLPFCFFLFALLFLLSFFRAKWSLLNKILDTLLYLASGAVGCILFFLMFFSEHPMVGLNYGILWLNPLFLLAVIGLWANPFSKRFFYLLVLLFISLLLSLLALALSLQYFNPAFVPCILILLISVACNLRIIVRRRYFKFQEIRK